MPSWILGNTPGPVGVGDLADPNTLMCRARSAINTIAGAPTLSDLATGTVNRLEFGDLELMSMHKFAGMSDSERRIWVASTLGRHERQLYESAAAFEIPVQLLAAILLNELLDIGLEDVLQETFSFAWNGSYGYAQIQTRTALIDELVPQDEALAIAKYFGMERVYAKGHLRVPQHAIHAAAKEIRILLDRARGAPESPWLMHLGFDASHAGPSQHVYDTVKGATPQDKEATLAELIAAGYNSPDIIDKANDPLRNYTRNAIPHGKNAAAVARWLYHANLFRAECR